MRQLNGVYTQRFHRRQGSSGHVFQGRFKSILVDKDSYLLQLCRYILLNPVRAGLVHTPADFKWSSYRATAGKDAVPEFLTVDWLLNQFAGFLPIEGSQKPGHRPGPSELWLFPDGHRRRDRVA